jgi:uncharacterized membrane protein
MDLMEQRAAGDRSPAASMSDAFLRKDEPLFAVILWPHRSMSRRGFRWLMGGLAAGLALPMLAVWGTSAALFLSPFLLGALTLVWALVSLNYHHARLREELRIWPDLMAVERREPWGRVRRWSANPYWVELRLRDTPAIERYLTLRGAGRTIELGAFLTPDERTALAGEIAATLRAIVTGRAPRAG